jgi:hypothetical protein
MTGALMTGKQIGVDCQFEADGGLRVRRIDLDGRWLAVGQGRQWVDQLGRHVLIMLPDDEVREILLQPDTMTWWLLPRGGGSQTRFV